MFRLPLMHKDEVRKKLHSNRAVISDTIANKLVCIIHRRLKNAPAEIKAATLKLCLDYIVKTQEVDAFGQSVATQKILSIDRIYPGRIGEEHGSLVKRSKWLLFFYLFNIDKAASTNLGKLEL